MNSRHSQRAGMDPETRLTLLEHDADELEDVAKSIDGKLSKVLYLVIGTALTTGTAAVLFAADLIIRQGGMTP